MFDLATDMYVSCCFYNFESILAKHHGNDIYDFPTQLVHAYQHDKNKETQAGLSVYEQLKIVTTLIDLKIDWLTD